MSYYAVAPDRVARFPLEGGIEITREQYKEAIGALSDPDDERVIVITYGVFALAVPPAPEPDPEPEPSPPTEQDYFDAIQSHIDNAAQSRGYMDGVSLASYVASTVPAWAAEAQTFVEWRDMVWSHAIEKLKANELPEVKYFIAGIPKIAWPVVT